MAAGAAHSRGDMQFSKAGVSKTLNFNLTGLLLLVAFAGSLLVAFQSAGDAVRLRRGDLVHQSGQQLQLQVVAGDYPPLALETTNHRWTLITHFVGCNPCPGDNSRSSVQDNVRGAGDGLGESDGGTGDRTTGNVISKTVGEEFAAEVKEDTNGADLEAGSRTDETETGSGSLSPVPGNVTEGGNGEVEGGEVEVSEEGRQREAEDEVSVVPADKEVETVVVNLKARSGEQEIRERAESDSVKADQLAADVQNAGSDAHQNDTEVLLSQGTDVVVVMEQRAAAPESSLRPRWRTKVEDQLKAAKLAIQDPSYLLEQNDTLHAPAYLNATLFRRSYDLMEKVFKTYVYSEGRKPLVHAGPLTGIYSSEGQFIDRMTKGSRFITQDPQEAHMFFLPYSVVTMVEKLYVPGSHSMLPLATFIKDYVNDVAGKHPYWNMTEGRDHFFVACHDWGPATARDHPTLRSNAVKVVCNADLTEEFVSEKDVSLPEVYLHKPRKGTKVYDMKIGGNGPAHRPFLAFFAGQMHGRVRPVLLEHWKDKDPDMKIYEVLPRALSKKMPYMNHMKRSKFCICAAGYEVNSPRVVESIYYECVPVIIADNFVLPFSDVLDWSTFSITVPEKDIPNLKQILLAISDERYRDLQGRLRYVRQHFLWHPKGPEKYDAFHMIMHSVWMRRLRQIQTD